MASQKKEIDRIISYIRSCQEAKEKQQAKESVGIDMCTCPKCGTYNETVGRRRNTVKYDIEKILSQNSCELPVPKVRCAKRRREKPCL